LVLELVRWPRWLRTGSDFERLLSCRETLDTDSGSPACIAPELTSIGESPLQQPAVDLRGKNLMANVSNETLTTIFIIATAVAVIIQAAILLALFIVVRTSVKKIHSEVEAIRTTAQPILDHTKDFVRGVTPKLDMVADDMVEMARGLRKQSMEFQASASDILERLHRQTGRMDTMVSGALDTVDRASTVVNDAVSVPLKHLSGWAAFAKAAVESFRSNGPKQPPNSQSTHSAADKDLFV
jgi:hypothetical protein